MMYGISMLKKVIIYFVFFLFLPTLFGSVNAIIYDLIAPQGTLRRGDQVQFTIYIDTEGATLTTGEIGMNYEIQYLEYISITPGPAMISVVATSQGAGSFLITGTNTSGFNGNDAFAYVNFKLIADAPGSSQLCVLWAPPTSPTPTSPPFSTPTTGVSTPTPINPSIGPTNPVTPLPPTPLGLSPTRRPTTPLPTSLPKTGSNNPQDFTTIFGGFLLATTVGLLLLKKV